MLRSRKQTSKIQRQVMAHVFISHLHTDRELAHGISLSLNEYGVTAFVAHDDIEPMEEWQEEIRQALLKMNLLVALLSPGFESSAWTDQEVGAAVGRDIPVVPVRMGKDPYGFIGKYQALSIDPNDDDADKEIAEFAFSQLIQAATGTDVYIELLRWSDSYAMSNRLAKYLPTLVALSVDQEESLVNAFNSNYQVGRADRIRDQIIQVLYNLTGHPYYILGSTYPKLLIHE